MDQFSGAASNTLLAPCWADRKGSAYRTCGTAALPWHRTCARPESDSVGRRRRSPGSRLHHWLRSTDPAAALVSAGFPSPCHIDAQNISEVTCFDQRSHYYHGLLGGVPRTRSKVQMSRIPET